MSFFSSLLSAGSTQAKKTVSKVSVKVASPAIVMGAISSAKNIASSLAKPVSSNKNKKQSGSSGGSTPAASSSGGQAYTAPAVSQDTLIQWHDVEFYANASRVIGFSDLAISGSIETEDKEGSGTKYVSIKNSKGYEASLKAYFDRRLGVSDVKAEAMKLVDYGARGQTGYLYSRGTKLITNTLMMTSAKANNIIMAPNGTWISCEVQITLKTCDKLDGMEGIASSTTSSSSSGSGGGSGGGTGGKSTKQNIKQTNVSLDAAKNGVKKSTQQTEAAKSESSKIGITNRNNQVQNKIKSIMTKKVKIE